MFKAIRQFFCKHEWDCQDWNYSFSHAPYPNVMGRRTCSKCALTEVAVMDPDESYPVWRKDA